MGNLIYHWDVRSWSRALLGIWWYRFWSPGYSCLGVGVIYLGVLLRARRFMLMCLGSSEFIRLVKTFGFLDAQLGEVLLRCYLNLLNHLVWILIDSLNQRCSRKKVGGVYFEGEDFRLILAYFYAFLGFNNWNGFILGRAWTRKMPKYARALNHLV